MNHTVTRNVSGTVIPFMLSAFSVFSISMVVQSLSSAFHVPVSVILIAIPIDFIGGAVGSIIIGRSADRIGRKPMMIISVLIFSISLILASFIRNLYELYVLWFAIGIGVNSQNGISYPIIVETLRKSTGSIGGVMQGTYFLGFLLDSVFFSFVHSWEHYFLISGIFSLVLALPATLMIIETKKRTLPSKPRHSLSGNLVYYTVSLSLIAVAAFMISVTLMSVVPTLLEEIKISNSFIIIFSVVGFASFACAGYLSDRFQKLNITIYFSILALISGIFLYIFYLHFVLLLFLVLAYVSSGFFGFIGVWSSETFPAEVRAAATNIVLSAGRILGGFSPIFSVILIPDSLKDGLSIMIAISAVVSLLGSLIYFRAQKIRSTVL